MQNTTMTQNLQQPPEKEQFYVFVDFANAYKDADKVDKSFRCKFQQPDYETRTDTTKTSVTMKTPSKLQGENLVESMAALIKYLREVKKTQEKAIIPAVKNQLSLIKKSMKENEECMEKWFEQFETNEGRKRFLEEDFPDERTSNIATACASASSQKSKSPIFWLRADHLLYICSRANTNGERVHKDKAYMFASHPPDGREKFMNSGIYLEMKKNYTVRLHERVQRDKHQAEKGVDVDLAVHVIDTIRTAESNGDKIRIVLVAGDSDYKSVIKYCCERRVPIDVWAWKGSISKLYQAYLESQKENVQVFLLDDYLYQLGYPPKDLLHPYGIAFFFRDQPPTREQDQIYNRIMHYTIAERLTRREDLILGFKTWDFVLHWGHGQWRNSTGIHKGSRGHGFTISFYTQESRTKFENYVRTSSDDLATALRHLEQLRKTFCLQDSDVVGENEEKGPSEDEKQNYIDESWSVE